MCRQSMETGLKIKMKAHEQSSGVPKHSFVTKKSQVSAELIIIFSVVFVVFAALVIAAYKNNDLLESSINEKYAKSQAQHLASEINNAYTAGNGFSKQIALPVSLRTGADYNLTINNTMRSVAAQWQVRESRTYSYPLTTSNVTGKLSDFNKTSISIANQNGQIIIS